MFSTEPDAPCGRCFLRLADAASLPPARIADYTVIRELGRGAMGTVYLAQRALPRKLVALKVLNPELADARVLRWFADEIEILGRLEHPHIVPIYDGKGLLHTPAFFAMRWIDGSTLADPINRKRYSDPEQAARLMVKIAGAVEFAHDRGVLHRDLKPGNILLDSAGEPYVSDFGLARMIQGESATAGAVAGSLGFMSPEQATAVEHGLTVSSDVYGLGALFYDLLTGVPARKPRDLTHLIQLFQAEPATDPRAIVPDIPHDLALVCLGALERDPKRRYRSAAEFGDDLQGVLQGRPAEPRNAAQPSDLRKAQYWARRHRIVVLLALTLVLLAGYSLSLPLFIEGDIQKGVREVNLTIAHAQAGSVLSELHSRRERAAAMAHDPAIATLVAWDNVYEPPLALAHYASGFDLVTVFKPDGTLVARYPKPTIQRYETLNYAFRDYFEGQSGIEAASRDSVYISKAFFSTGDKTLQIGFAAPIFDAQGARIGVSMLGVTVRSTFGAVRLDPGHAMTALLGARDRDAQGKGLPKTLSVLAAPGLALGVDKPVDAELSRQICERLNCVPHRRDQLERQPLERVLTLPDYRDPMTGERSIAALAPVGDTGIIVVVATPYTVANRIKDALTARFSSYLWLPLVLGFGFTVLLVSVPWKQHRGRAWRRHIKS